MEIELATAATDVRISDVHFEGDHANAIYINQPGLTKLAVTGCTFRNVGYGVLLNRGAAGASDLELSNNLFVGVTGDAIELNAAPGSSPASVRRVTISRNKILRQRGTSDNAGFGVGLSGIKDFTISANIFEQVRNEAVHLEDNSTHGTVSQNIVAGGGSGNRPAIAVYRTVSHVLINHNRITKFSGNGIATLWDPYGSSLFIDVDHNDIDRVTGAGIVLAGDAGTGPFAATSNRVALTGGIAIGVYGTHARSTETNNVITIRPGHVAFGSKYRGSGETVRLGNTVRLQATVVTP